MKWTAGWILLASTVLASNAMASDVAVPPELATTTCPAPTKRAPVYPVEMMRRRKGGTVLLDLSVDACGRVQQVNVKQSSGQKQLDDAAVTAVGQWILGPTGRAKAVAGRMEIPVSFDMAPTQSIAFAKLDWPKSHKRPQYRLDPMAEFSSADAASQAIRVPVEKTIMPPYPGIQSQFFRYGEGAVPEYWLFIRKGHETNLAARYRLTYDGAVPTVLLSIACDDQPDACAKASDFLMKGLPFARAK